MATQTNWAPRPPPSPGESMPVEEQRADGNVIKDSSHPAHRRNNRYIITCAACFVYLCLWLQMHNANRDNVFIFSLAGTVLVPVSVQGTLSFCLSLILWLSLASRHWCQQNWCHYGCPRLMQCVCRMQTANWLHKTWIISHTHTHPSTKWGHASSIVIHKANYKHHRLVFSTEMGVIT